MSDEMRCDRCVDMVHPPTDCRDCELERRVAEAIPEAFEPRVVNLHDVEQESAALTEQWQDMRHPADVVASIRSLASTTDAFYATLVARSALEEFVRYVAYVCPLRDQQAKSALLFPILRTLRELAPANSSTTATTRSTE